MNSEVEELIPKKTYINSRTQQLRLFYTSYPVEHAKASVIIVHGLGQYSLRFENVALHLSKLGFKVHSVDLRGFGYSGGARGCSKVHEFHMDLASLIQQTDQDLPLFIYAHSMGGLITTTFLIENPQINVSGVILTSPLLGLPKDRKVGLMKKLILDAVGDDLDQLVINNLVNPTALTKNNVNVRKVFQDRLMFPFMGIGMAKSILSAAQYVIPNAHRFMAPLLILHGEKDIVTDCQDSKRFKQLCSSRIKIYKGYPNGYHQLQHDQQLKDILKQSETFLNEILQRNPPKRGRINSAILRFGVKAKKGISKKIKSIVLLALWTILYRIMKRGFLNKWACLILAALGSLLALMI